MMRHHSGANAVSPYFPNTSAEFCGLTIRNCSAWNHPQEGEYGVSLARLVRHDAGWLAEVGQARLVRQRDCETRSGATKGSKEWKIRWTVLPLYTNSRNLPSHSFRCCQAWLNETTECRHLI